MATPISSLPSITVTPLACLITRTVYNTMLDLRREPPHRESTAFDFLISVRGLTAWIFAQHDLRTGHPQQSHDDIEAFLWEREARRNELVLTRRSLFDKSSEEWLEGRHFKDGQRQSRVTSKRTSRRRSINTNLHVLG
jgi:hypothetical protein